MDLCAVAVVCCCCSHQAGAQGRGYSYHHQSRQHCHVGLQAQQAQGAAGQHSRRGPSGVQAAAQTTRLLSTHPGLAPAGPAASAAAQARVLLSPLCRGSHLTVHSPTWPAMATTAGPAQRSSAMTEAQWALGQPARAHQAALRPDMASSLWTKAVPGWLGALSPKPCCRAACRQVLGYGLQAQASATASPRQQPSSA